jgi:hypothetical protein
MKKTINFYEFRDAFFRIRPTNFSPDGLIILFEYLEQWEQDTGEELELDVIALCCDFSEEFWRDVAEDYGIEIKDIENEEDQQQAVMDYLSAHTSVCGITDDGGIVYQVF